VNQAYEISHLLSGAMLVTSGGCMGLFDPEKTAQVSPQFFESAPSSVARSPLPLAEDSVCVRVDFVGRKLVGANQHVGLKPLFMTILDVA